MTALWLGGPLFLAVTLLQRVFFFELSLNFFPFLCAAGAFIPPGRLLLSLFFWATAFFSHKFEDDDFFRLRVF